MPAPDDLLEAIRPQLFKAFKPAFLGRLAVVPFYPLADEVLARVIRLKLARIAKRVAENHQSSFTHDDELVDSVLLRCTMADAGARNVDNILNGSLLPQLAESVLAWMADGRDISRIAVGVSEHGEFRYDIR